MHLTTQTNIVTPDVAMTLDGLFGERVRRTPDAVAYTEFDEEAGVWRDYTWAQMERLIARWQVALKREPLAPGDRIAIMLRNSTTWVALDQAAMGLGLVVVPLYTQDRPDNVAYIIENCGAKLLLFDKPEQWAAFADVKAQLASLVRILHVKPTHAQLDDTRIASLGSWLPDRAEAVEHVTRDGTRLASIVYTSGTTGRPKGVMLSHNNMLSNAFNTLQVFDVDGRDTFL